MKKEYFFASLYWRGLRPTLIEYFNLVEGKIRLADYLRLKKKEHLIDKQKDWQQIFKSELEYCQKENIKLLTPYNGHYPKEFINMEKPPLAITGFGDIGCLNSNMISIVGSCNPSSDSLKWMDEQLYRFLNNNDITVVSGGARGVDQKAHALAISSGRPTICFLPSGLKYMYPSQIKNWIIPIIESKGCILSQFSPFERMMKGHFHTRNELIAKVSQFLFVIQAARRSGSMVTAQKAIQFGKDIFVLPSSPCAVNSLGGLDLIFDGAHMIRDYDDLNLVNGFFK